MNEQRPQVHARIAPDARRVSPVSPPLILGGGIGGMAAAIALARRGLASRILEKRIRYEPEGAGIQIGPNGTRILQQLGIAEALQPLAGKPDAIHVRDAGTGRTLTRLPLGAWIEARHGAPYWFLHRSDLHHALHQAALASPLITITQGFDAITIDDETDAVLVRDRQGNSAVGCGLIAADGLRSLVRDEIFGPAPLHYAGKSAARAVIPAEAMPKELAENATGLWLSPVAHIVHYPVRSGREVALVFVRKDSLPSDDWSTEIASDWVLECAKQFAPSLRDLLHRPPVWKKWALFELPALPRWSLGRICLLGDAAHPTLPFLAQGAVLALEDASMVARIVEKSGDDIAAAFAAYDGARRKRASAVVGAARSNGRIYHLSGPLAGARDLTMRMTPPRVLMSRYDWVYGYKI